MNPKKINHSQGQLFEARLSEQLNPDHELFTFTKLLNWEALVASFADKFVAEVVAPAKPVRQVTSVMILEHMYGLSDEGVVMRWVENPYWQYFYGYDFLRWKFPIHPKTLTKWRKRVGVEGFENVFELLVNTEMRAGVMVPKMRTITSDQSKNGLIQARLFKQIAIFQMSQISILLLKKAKIIYLYINTSWFLFVNNAMLLKRMRIFSNYVYEYIDNELIFLLTKFKELNNAF